MWCFFVRKWRTENPSQPAPLKFRILHWYLVPFHSVSTLCDESFQRESWFGGSLPFCLTSHRFQFCRFSTVATGLSISFSLFWSDIDISCINCKYKNYRLFTSVEQSIERQRLGDEDPSWVCCHKNVENGARKQQQKDTYVLSIPRHSLFVKE